MQPVFAEQTPMVELHSDIDALRPQNPKPALQAVPTPEPSPALTTTGLSCAVARLQSFKPGVRRAAAELLIKDGGQAAATKLEFLLQRDNARRHAELLKKPGYKPLSHEVRHEVASTLLALSVNHAPHLAKDDLGSMRRLLTLGSAMVRPKTRLSPVTPSPSTVFNQR